MAQISTKDPVLQGFLLLLSQPLIMEDNQNDKDVSVKDEASHEATNKGPVWSDESPSKRVRATIWEHRSKGSRVRRTVGLCRSYLDRESGRWVNTSYFDRKDLDDLIDLAQTAKKKLDRMVDAEPAETDAY